MQNWQTVRLTDVVTDITNGYPGGQDESGDGIPVTRIETIQNNILDLTRVKYAKVSDVDSKKYLLNVGDILFSHINSMEHIGKVAIVTSDALPLLHGVNLLKIRVNEKLCNARFLYYYFQTHPAKEQISRKSRKAVNQASINQTQLRQIIVTLPSIPLQRQIVERLDAIKVWQEIDNKELVKSDEIFISHLKKILSSQPRWTVEHLNLITNIKGGGTPSKSKKDYWNGHIPWVSPKDMKSFEISDTEDHISDEAVKNSSTTVVPEQSVLIVFRSGILKHSVPVGMTTRNMAINQDMKALICGEKILPKFLFFWMIANTPRIKACIKTGGTVQSIDSKKFSSLEVSFPDIEEQRRLISQAESLLELVNKKRETGVLLKELFDSVLNKAMRGELVQ